MKLMTKAILEKLEMGKPISVTARFSYYNEIMTIKKNDDGLLDVETSLVFGDRYDDGTQSFTDVVTVDEFIAFLENRLSEEKTTIMNGRSIQMAEYIQEFTWELHKQANVAKAKAQREIVAKFLETIKPKMTSDEIDWSKDNAVELYEELSEQESTIKAIANAFESDELDSHDMLTAFKLKVKQPSFELGVFVSDPENRVAQFEEFLQAENL